MASPNLLSTVNGTPGNAAGLTLVEQYLVEKYLKEREFNTPLAQSGYGSSLNLPEMSGQYAKFTRPQKMRTPEVATEDTDPESGAPMAYEQINIPIEWINDYTGFSTMAMQTSWIKLAEDAKTHMFESIKRYMNRATQAAMLVGRFKPGHRNSAGLTTGAGSYPHFWTTPEPSMTAFGQTFNFASFPTYYINRKPAFAQLEATDKWTMDEFRQKRVLLANAGAHRINGKFIAVISESIQAELERDDEYFAAAIRNQGKSDKLFAGQVADYAGMHWILDDEPFAMTLGGTENKLVEGGNVHVAQVFGQDAFGYLRLGGKRGTRPTFKVQDISKTGTTVTAGYMVPFQVAVLNRAWGCNIVGPVNDGGANGSV